MVKLPEILGNLSTHTSIWSKIPYIPEASPDVWKYISSLSHLGPRNESLNFKPCFQKNNHAIPEKKQKKQSFKTAGLLGLSGSIY